MRLMVLRGSFRGPHCTTSCWCTKRDRRSGRFRSSEVRLAGAAVRNSSLGIQRTCGSCGTLVCVNHPLKSLVLHVQDDCSPGGWHRQCCSLSQHAHALFMQPGTSTYQAWVVTAASPSAAEVLPWRSRARPSGRCSLRRHCAPLPRLAASCGPHSKT